MSRLIFAPLPLLWLAAFLVETIVIAIAGTVSTSAPVSSDPALGTVFVVFHPKIVTWPLAAIPLFYAVWPAVTRRALDAGLGWLHLLLTFAAFNVCYFAALASMRAIRLGESGNVLPASQSSIGFGHLVSIALSVLLSSQLVPVYAAIRSLRGETALRAHR